MNQREQTERILREWQGSDAAERQTPEQVAAQIELVYRSYDMPLIVNDPAGVPACACPQMAEPC